MPDAAAMHETRYTCPVYGCARPARWFVHTSGHPAGDRQEPTCTRHLYISIPDDAPAGYVITIVKGT